MKCPEVEESCRDPGEQRGPGAVQTGPREEIGVASHLLQSPRSRGTVQSGGTCENSNEEIVQVRLIKINDL